MTERYLDGGIVLVLGVIRLCDFLKGMHVLAVLIGSVFVLCGHNSVGYRRRNILTVSTGTVEITVYA